MSELIEVKQKLDIITTLFTEFLCDLLEMKSFNDVNIVGIGNSISAGWTATNNNVQPLV